MHFSRLAVVALPILTATASVLPRNDGCSGGSTQCCNSVLENNGNNPVLNLILSLIGLPISNVGAALGLTCTSLNVGIGQTCQSNTVCCTGNNQQVGLINFSTGCTPIIL